MPRRAVPARFMSNACSKNFAAASGSGTMSAMWRSLAMVTPFGFDGTPETRGHLAETATGAQISPPRHRGGGAAVGARLWVVWGAAPGRAAAGRNGAFRLAGRQRVRPFEHLAALVGLAAPPPADLRDVAQIANGRVDGGQQVDVMPGSR